MNKKANVELVILGAVAVISLAGLVMLFAGDSQPTGQFMGTAMCSDSDGGTDFYTQGTLGYAGNSFTDTCANNQNEAVDGAGPKLIEYYCRAGAMFTTVQRCINGCVNGACLREPSGLAFNPDV
jgi:hypothetical protein